MIDFSGVTAPGDVIAVGDIHATWTLYEDFLSWIKGSETIVILLGDLIDRGGEDLKVLDTTKAIANDPESWGLQGFHVIRGNHEQMFINAMENSPYSDSALHLWVQNGGNGNNALEMKQRHLEWIKQTPLYMVVGDTMFIHAGVYPGVNPEDILETGSYGLESILWVREPFLSQGPCFEKWNPNLKRVVHGHTPTPFETCNQIIPRSSDAYLPVITKNRVNIDTGAYSKRGRLTAYNATTNTFKQFFRGT